ncbi:alpha-L-fucosidase [Halosquirtibacter laminarini]|uniref:Alpha-L-fucosidase n=1 Tax=Halosquirtibacter laminarini TaxID=3374600 RepID=A0AC61NJL0_9BACT|nr:alpha-L-fucosidase [Prolixibacteraceae bacterium]
MKKIASTILLLFVFLIGSAQEKKLTWEELKNEFECPQWFENAGFGVWAHWGAQVQPEMGGGWYARHLYMPDVGKQLWGKNAYKYHCEHYGHPSEFGYKDVLNEWKAKNLDTDVLLKYFKKIGAKYFMILANHHDRFDNFNSTYFEWNSVNVGPHKDIVGEFEKSSRKYGLPFGVSSHDDRFLKWWLPAFGADKTGPYKGVPYDGHMTKADGIGKWWEGLDPANLYGLPPEKRTPEWETKMKETWVKRHRELVTKYDVDMLWFDGHDFPYGKYGKEVCTDFYNYKLKKYGKLNAIVCGKFTDEPSTIKDFEKGGSSIILPKRWQGTLSINSWFYKKDRPNKHNARTVIETLVDVNSKNGNLLLNIALLPDGTMPKDQKEIFDKVGEWMKINGDAIYACKPWKIYGDNLRSDANHANSDNIREVDAKELKKQLQNDQFNQRTIASPMFHSNEVRFTTKKGTLYMFVLNPQKGQIKIPSLGTSSKQQPGHIKSIKMLGARKKVDYQQKEDGLILNVPNHRPTNFVTVFEIKGVD